MNVSIGDRWEDFVEKLVKSGRYGAASELVREGRRLVEDVKTASRRFILRLTPSLPKKVSRRRKSPPPLNPPAAPTCRYTSDPARSSNKYGAFLVMMIRKGRLPLRRMLAHARCPAG